MKFREFNLSEEVARAVKDMGFSAPTPIQEQAVPHGLDGKDIIGQARTGTGKTVAFGIPMVERIDSSNKHVQAIVLTPTRELAKQVANEIEKIGKYKWISVLAVYGGVSIGKQIRALERGVQVMVGTPGRVIDHIRRGTLNLRSVRLAVLDEADRMLDMGFIDDMKFILAEIENKSQIMLFSATIPSEFAWISQKYMNNPVRVTVSDDSLTVPQTRQMFFDVGKPGKLITLTKLIDSERKGVFLVFRRTKVSVDKLEATLKSKGYSARAMHGDYTQRQREKVVKLFKKGKIDILVATDVAARGLDISGITHVINYDIPQDAKSYVHRIGRTGRAGKDGTAITFVTRREYGELKRIQDFSKANIERASISNQGVTLA